jgi:glycosyltransferase involved in cell wall biosynthesis
MHCTGNEALRRLFLKLAPRAASIECFDIGLLPLAQLCGPMPDIRFRPGIGRHQLLAGLASHPAADLLTRLADRLWDYGGTLYGDGIDLAPEWSYRRILVVGEDFDEDAGSPSIPELLTRMADLSGANIDYASMARAKASPTRPEPLAPSILRFIPLRDHSDFGSLLDDHALVLVDAETAQDRQVTEMVVARRQPFRVLPSPLAPAAGSATQRISGFDPGCYLYDSERDYLFTREHRSDRPFLLVLGRKMPEAGVAFICRAFDLGGSPYGDLVFIGAGDERLVQRSSAIYSYNYFDGAAKLGALHRCRALVTMRTSGGTTAPIEAWLSERAVIANLANPAHCALIEHGKNGFLVGSLEDVAAAMSLVLRHAAVAATVGQNGRRAADQFTWSKVVRSFLAREHEHIEAAN